MSNSDNK